MEHNSVASQIDWIFRDARVVLQRELSDRARLCVGMSGTKACRRNDEKPGLRTLVWDHNY
jgi:hypothetical protein